MRTPAWRAANCYRRLPRCEDSIGWRAVPISRLNLDEYNLLTVHT
ncbi:hypothetical protein [Bordetella pertussis]|nr:hypothetical protein [Bordetella pertussis]